MQKFIKLSILLILIAFLAACSSGSNASNSSSTVADAGTNKSVLSWTRVTLDGSKSIGANGNLIQYQWSFVSKPNNSTAILANDKTVNPSFVPDLVGDYILKLVVTDNSSSTKESQVTISVAKGNAPPNANAGTAQSVSVGRVVSLDGSASTDAESDTLSYQWTITPPTGSTATLSAATSAKPTFTADVAGSYVLSLLVNDGKHTSDMLTSASVTVTATANSTPVANAGTNSSTAINQLVTLDGTASSDADISDTITYSWSTTSVPTGSSVTVLTNPTTAKPSFTPDVPGAYVFNLVVSDGKSSSAPVSVTITAAGVPKVSTRFVVTDATTGVTVSVPDNAYDGSVSQPVITTSKLTALPPGATLPSNADLGEMYALNKNYAYGFLQPVDVTVPFDPTKTVVPVVYYYDSVNNKYVAAQIKAIDMTAKTLTFTTVHFSHYVIMSARGITPSSPSIAAIDTTFDPKNDGFFHPNFGSFVTPGGCSLGMSDLAIWYFVNKKATDNQNLLPSKTGLYNKWREGDINSYQDDVTARTVISAVQKAASQVWTNSWKQPNYTISDQYTGLLLIGAMNVTKVPQVLLMKAVDATTTADTSALATVVYKYTPDTTTPNKGKFSLYDPDFPGEEVTIDWSLTGGFSGFSKAGAYSATFTKYAFDGLNSIGDSPQYNALLTAADGSLATITLTAPTPIVNDSYNQTITGTTIPSVQLTGSATGSPSMIGYVLNGGALQYTTVSNGTFSFTLAGADLKSKNTLMIAAVGNPLDPWSFTGFKQLTIIFTGTSVNVFQNFGFEDSILTSPGWLTETHLLSGMVRDVTGSPDPTAANYNKNWGHVSRFQDVAQTTTKGQVVTNQITSYAGFTQYASVTAGVDPVIDYYQKMTGSPSLGQAASMPVVYNGSNALRINNWDNSYHVSVATQKALIPSTASGTIRFAWAAILEDPAHRIADQPFVEVTVLDTDTNTYLYRKHFFSGDPSYSGWIHMDAAYTPTRVLWNIIPWQQVTVDISSAVGHNVEIRVIAADCNLGGHGGYAYLDDSL